MAEVQIFDNKVVKAPGAWKGEKAKWRQWSMKMRGFIAGVSKKMLRMVKIAQDYPGPILSHEGWDNDQITLDHQLYSMHNRWLIQIPRLYAMYQKNRMMRTFAEMVPEGLEPSTARVHGRGRRSLRSHHSLPPATSLALCC